MTSRSCHERQRVLAPFPPDNLLKPSGPLPRRTKRSNACIACKARRIKCGGTHPCDKCVATGRNCMFVVEGDRRRKYAQRRAEQDLSTANQLLDDIVKAFYADDNAQLDRLLFVAGEYRAGRAMHDAGSGNAEQVSETPSDDFQMKVEEDVGDQVGGIALESAADPLDSVSGGTTCVPPSAGLLDETTQDPNRDETSRATGYIGKGSEISWLQDLGSNLNKLNTRSSHIDDSSTSMNYHLDHVQIPEPVPTEPRWLPPKPWAAHLLNIFFGSVEPSFPLIDKTLFMTQFDQAFTPSGAEPSRKWLAVLNLMLAVGSRYHQLSEPDSGRDIDDRVFLSRAIALSTPSGIATRISGLQQVQIHLLLAIYYLASGQVNQSWQVNGHAARLAISIGLNLRADNDQIDPLSKETRARIWWSIISLEHILSGMTGRIPYVDYQAMSMHLPLPHDEVRIQQPQAKQLLGNTALHRKQVQWTIDGNNSDLFTRDQWLSTIIPSQSLYFFHLTDLAVTMNAASNAVYSLTATNSSIKSSILFYQGKLQSWLSSLQPVFEFTAFNAKHSTENPDAGSNDSKEQVGLALAYYGSQVILNRPCLTRPDVKPGTNIQIPRSYFGDTTAKACVHFALAIISVLPDEPDMKWVLKMTSWWYLLHTIMRALTILLIQLSIGQVPILTTAGNQMGKAREGEDVKAVRDASKKALFWLHSMAKQDPSSRRAFHISQKLFNHVTLQMPDGREPSIVSVSVSQADSLPSRRQASGDFGFGSMKLLGDAFNWGPDNTGSESRDEQQQAPLSLDPALLSFDKYDS